MSLTLDHLLLFLAFLSNFLKSLIKALFADIHIFTLVALESWAENWFGLADIAFEILMKYIFINCVFQEEKLILLELGCVETWFADVEIGLSFRLIPFNPKLYLLFALVASWNLSTV